MKCPECKKEKPADPKDLHDVVLPRWDYRQAERPTIETPIPSVPMCLACFLAIQEEWAPKAPVFDKPTPRKAPEPAGRGCWKRLPHRRDP